LAFGLAHRTIIPVNAFLNGQQLNFKNTLLLVYSLGLRTFLTFSMLMMSMFADLMLKINLQSTVKLNALKHFIFLWYL